MRTRTLISLLWAALLTAVTIGASLTVVLLFERLLLRH